VDISGRVLGARRWEDDSENDGKRKNEKYDGKENILILFLSGQR
jgi:hypothetical protein